MEKHFLNILRDPINKEELQLLVIESIKDNIIEGVLLNKNATRIYPVHQGVPILLNKPLPKSFFAKHEDFINKLKTEYTSLQVQVSQEATDWSFSLEWEYHANDKMEKTWGMTLEKRYNNFLIETQTDPTILNQLLILDAGCGNGMHTENLANKGATMIGIDFSTSVFNAEKNRKAKNLLFLQGDLTQPPFANGTFDLIISNGVIHHTPNTFTTFKAISKLPKINGKLYLWLYNQQGNFAWRFKRSFFDVSRVVVCRMPDGMKKAMVNIYTQLLFNVRKVLGKKDDIKDMRLDMYDSITPRWRHYHEPFEVWNWYIGNGFANPVITNWETLYGYGIYGKRIL